MIRSILEPEVAVPGSVFIRAFVMKDPSEDEKCLRNDCICFFLGMNLFDFQVVLEPRVYTSDCVFCYKTEGKRNSIEGSSEFYGESTLGLGTFHLWFWIWTF